MVSQRRLALEWTALLIGSVLLAALVVHGGFTQRISFSILDFATSLGPHEPAPDIAIVAIDERSLAALGEWPWRRATHAEVIDNLRAAGAKVVLYDVLLVEPGDPQDDAALAGAIARHGKVALPFSFIPALNQAEGYAPEYPLPAFAKAAAALGHVEVAPDSDGVLRRFSLELPIAGQSYPQFAPAALLLTKASPPPIGAANGDPPPIVPFNPIGAYPIIPAYAVVNGTVPKAMIEGRTILVGATAQGMGDTQSVAAGDIGIMSGVETQANLFDALRSGALIRELPAVWSILLAAAALVVQFLGFWKLSARSGFVLSIALLAGIIGVVIALVHAAQVWIAPGAALRVVALAYPVWSWRRLTVVSAYLKREAEQLVSTTGERQPTGGFDLVAQQVNRMRQLVGEVTTSLTFIRNVIEASPDAMLVTGEDQRVTLVNTAALRLFDQTPEPVGHSLPDLYLNQNLLIDHDAREVTLPDGRAFMFASAALASNLVAGQGSDIIAFRDITEMRRRQRENDELIEFLSHDMRSPQVAIIALTQALGAENAELAARIRSQAQLTLGLADGFVQLARIQETGAQFASHDLAFLLDEAIDQAFPLAARKGITLQRAIPAHPVFADIDPAQIARMASNLIGNAVKYTQDGGEVVIKLALIGADEAQISVADNGPGLPPERLDDPFARFGPRTDPDGLSAGLGLTFVKRVVDAHHGQITASPNPGGGMLFAIRLPLAQSDDSV